LIITTFFPRNTNTNGYSLPKMHEMTKMQEYMMLFGSGINFYGGPGESAHKQFIKIPRQRRQRRVSEFAQHTALQYCNILVSDYVAHDSMISSHLYKNQEILTQMTLLNQKEMLSLKCQEI
jgi:hypothetical protein